MPGYWHDAELVAFGGMVFATGNGGTVAFDGATGETKWISPYGGERASPAVTSEGLYMIPSSCGAKALSPLTGKDLWTATICGDNSADIATRDGIVYARYFGSGPHMIDATTGKQVGSVSSQRSPAITDTSVITLYSGALSSTSIANGSQEWTFMGDGELVSAPIVVNSTVFVGSSSGKVYALDSTTGAQQWFGSIAAMSAPDQWNGRLLPGPTAGEGLLVVTGGNTVAAWSLK